MIKVIHHITSPKKQSGFVLLSAIFVMIMLGGMLALIMKNVTHSNTLVTQAIYHHHVSSALNSQLQLVSAELNKTKECEDQKYSFQDVSMWKNIHVQIRCTLDTTQNPAYQLKATARLDLPNSVIRVEKEVKIPQKD